jgi:quercetin dioxygenase-like cupin family protein
MKVHETPESAAEAGPAQFFAGEVRTQTILQPDEGLDIVLVRFSPGSRTYWHTHQSPQVLHCVEGRGVLATRSERSDVGPGDIVHIAPGEEHWHGAAAESAFTHLSIRAPGETEWTTEDPLA